MVIKKCGNSTDNNLIIFQCKGIEVFRQSAICIYIWSVLSIGFVSILSASEDSVEEVMEGYESPQKLFLKEEPTKDKTSQTNAQKDIAYTHYKEVSTPPKWLYSTAIVETLFHDGSFRKGLGTLLQNNFYITSTEIIYNGKIAPKKIYAKMQDDLNANIMCVALLEIKAVDLDSGLALLKIAQYVDSYCQVRKKSYYQDRISKRFGVDVFSSSDSISPNTEAYYPYLNSSYVFQPQSMILNRFAAYYDFTRRQERIYGFEIGRDSYEEFTYGRAFYDHNGVFLGIMSRIGTGYLPVVLNRHVIQDFLCDMQDKRVINDELIGKACLKLGTQRMRFFTDTKASFF